MNTSYHAQNCEKRQQVSSETGAKTVNLSHRAHQLEKKTETESCTGSFEKTSTCVRSDGQALE